MIIKIHCYFEKTVSFVPDYAEAYFGMQQAYTALGKTNEAKYAQAMVSYSQKDYDTAIPVLKQVTKDLPSFEPGFTGLGLACEAKKDLQCALAAYSTASNLEKNDFTASQGLVRVQTALKK